MSTHQISMAFAFFCFASFCHTSFSEEHKNYVRDLGIVLPSGSKRIAEHRFLSSQSYEKTKQQFREQFANSATIKPLGEEINLPNVRAVFYKNLDPNAQFFAINIYQNEQTGLTEIFFVMKDNTMHENKF